MAAIGTTQCLLRLLGAPRSPPRCHCCSPAPGHSPRRPHKGWTFTQMAPAEEFLQPPALLCSALCPGRPRCSIGSRRVPRGARGAQHGCTTGTWAQRTWVGEHGVHCLRLLIIQRSISLFLIKYKDYLTVIITTRWLRIKGAASKACLREAEAGSASFIINHQEFLFSVARGCLPSIAWAPVRNPDPYKIPLHILKQTEQKNNG